MKQNRILIILLILSIIIVLITNIIFNDTEELFPKGSELGNVLSNLSLAYISSYIFYLVIVKFQESRDKKNIYSTIYSLTKQLVGRGNSVVNTLASANKYLKPDLTKNITKEEFIELCKTTNPKEISPNTMIGKIGSFNKATYSQLIYNNSFSNTKALIEKIFVYMPFLESDFVKLLNELSESTFFMMADVLANPHLFQNNDFTNMADPMFEYHLTLRKIENYIEEHYKKYIS